MFVNDDEENLEGNGPCAICDNARSTYLILDIVMISKGMENGKQRRFVHLPIDGFSQVGPSESKGSSDTNPKMLRQQEGRQRVVDISLIFLGYFLLCDSSL